MALIDQAMAEAKRPGVRCAFGKWFDTIDDDLRAEVRDLLANADVQTSALGRVITKVSGLRFDNEKAARHRPGAGRPCGDCQAQGRIS